MHYRSTSYRIFTTANTILLTFLAILCILPLVHVLAVSLSSSTAADANLVKLWPMGFTTEAYKVTLSNELFVNSFGISVLRTVLGTLISLLLSVMVGYALSKESEHFRGRNFYAWFLVFTMLFSGGLIPGYIVVQKLGLINSIWSLILPGALSVYNTILLLNFFRSSVPKALEEAAFIDGAGHFRTLWKIYLPISLPSLATISLFTMVGHWNAWFDGLIYMTDSSRYPMSTLLQTIVVQRDLSSMSVSADEVQALSNRTVKTAQIFIATIPIIAVYPFLQRFFVKGIVLGSVKE
ncbi:carbohydrate ABC transporter permease [Paenibacillus lemnae]|uniref:Carbohydrate ABC transporter permease n=1 Tax=Paenibacillus lemnae TaxID=1330551 RepID=A0A848M503_PAELE|nr:carbohydrate ABC transporter permease [Paenibacillus lemnae]NMO94714.1 carbohydrate ABC transporter permease [Paenibacillus lemnae]